ncbi:MAG: DMT family transporter [Acidobacteriota bacterium]|nr:MAG: DMT family transporter [Acidobacteriota bacterium]
MTLAALVCFAANSLLSRYALGEGLGMIDAATFTTVRLAAGAVMLGVLMRPRGRPVVAPAIALFAYASFFSFAYNYVTAATGALLLFGAVQATMLVGAMLSGERLSRLQWVGLLVAISGLAYLLFPGLEAPPVIGAFLMLLSGVAWGVYSLQEQSVSVAHHFMAAVPLAVVVNLAFFSDIHVSSTGLLVAVVSGALTSGLGYAIWFRALKTLSATVAGTAQLAVPVIAAAGGVWLLSEGVTMRLVIASIIVLAGIALTLPIPTSWRIQWRDVVARVSSSCAEP